MVLPVGTEQDFVQLKNEVLERIYTLRNAVEQYSWSDVELECRSASLWEFLQVSRGILLNTMASNLTERYLTKLTLFAIAEKHYRPLTRQEKDELQQIIDKGRNAQSEVICDMARTLQRQPQVFATLREARLMSAVASLTAVSIWRP